MYVTMRLILEVGGLYLNFNYGLYLNFNYAISFFSHPFHQALYQ